MPYTRPLNYRLPLVSGYDVVSVQLRLRDLGYADVGQPDGIFGIRTETAVCAFQQANNLKVDGIVGPLTWTALFKDTGADTSLEKIKAVLADLKMPHAYRDSVQWHLGPSGLVLGDTDAETTGGEPKTVRSVWERFNTPIEEWSVKLGVPVELIVATICTETTGDSKAERQEQGYISDEKTPDRLSIGLMQTLITTARSVLGDRTISRNWLLDPGNSIRAGSAYIAMQWKITHFDPPKVACAYNAGGIYYNESQENRWRMRQYPINSSAHADRFIKWFNDCFLMFEAAKLSPSVSFYRLLR